MYKHPELSRKIVVLGDANHTLRAGDKSPQKVSAIDNILREMQVAGLTAAQQILSLDFATA